ncbi:ubiquitin-protein ligase E3B [Tetranychus urticae]|uniref:Ubiquitin-protein ligase E3B n=1 Tax=Tetranychus urticae TaxID=32264 RepID=T1K8E1_TETUR|nr:ubiquitin-protein ligase E3B [Tetranychus urticae]
MVNLKEEFIEATKAARLSREKEKKIHASAIIIQKYFRGFLTRRRLTKEFISDFNEKIKDWKDGEEKPPFIEPIEAFRAFNKLLWVTNVKRELHLLEKMCRYIIATMFNSDAENDGSEDGQNVAYVIVAFDRNYTVPWIHQMKAILLHCSSLISTLRPEKTSEFRSIMLFLNMMVTFTSPSSWPILQQSTNKNYSALRPVMNQLCSNILNHLVAKGCYLNLQSILNKGLCKSKPSLNKPSLTAVLTLSLRHMINCQFNEASIKFFLVHILSTPGLIYHLQNLCPDTTQALQNHKVFSKCIHFLNTESTSNQLSESLEANYGLCLLANLINLGYLDQDLLKELLMDFVIIVAKLLEGCQKYVSSKQSSLTHWHPILGYFAQNVDSGLHESFVHVKKQLQYLWSVKMINIMFEPLFEATKNQRSSRKQSLIYNENCYDSNDSDSYSSATFFGRSNFFRRVIDRASQAVNKATNSRLSSSYSVSKDCRELVSPEVTVISLICSMYVSALETLSQVKMDILTGLCYQDLILPNLWKFISSFGARNGLNVFLDLLTVSPKASAFEFQLLILFCDCATHLIAILDEKEFYEDQKPFSLQELLSISSFLNNFVYKIIASNLIDFKGISLLLNSTHSLLMVLYKRDSRRSFAPSDHWLIKEIKVANFLKDLENGKKSAQILMMKVPHIIPHKERVVLFRKQVNNEKTVLGITESACASSLSTLITIHRSRIVEDGYQQLVLLPPHALKGIIRVKFINEQGLDEAGIDQDGVFKEFLEETIKKVFDPSLNLFKVTSEQRLYPSPTSYIHENHLSLFEFVGRMLGKAVYEGIVADVPFASFFLSQVLHQQQNALYSSIDELPSLDPELYKNLTYVKHYDGDVAELDLTFSVDEDCMGKIVSHELMPGGRITTVNNENKISYIHLMAHFRVHRQIRDQTAAFIKGFRCIVNPDWLTMFSTPEFQRLISGDNNPIDLTDLRRNTKYYGGFHNNHKVINWFWDILEKDFKPEEHRLLLKFVTSCSKPPLLGFTHLKPQFSIRCVEVSEDQDVGDTVGSVLRGFFTLRRKGPVNRLPSSSTCFNLLKLPNYQKKSVLRDKLRYAITNNTGFELS